MVKFKVVLILVCFIALSACTTERKAVRYFNNHPELSSGWCADKYPVRDSIAPPVVVYKPATNVDYSKAIDSINKAYNQLRHYADSINNIASIDSSECGRKYSPIINRLNSIISNQSTIISKLRDDYKKCEPDTAFITNNIYRENTAKVASLQLRLDKLNEINAANIKWKRFFMWWAIGASVVIGIGVVLRLIRR